MSEGKHLNAGIAWRGSLFGAAVGAGIGLLAFLFDESPWWWLAVLAGALVGASSVNLQFSANWGGKRK